MCGNGGRGYLRGSQLQLGTHLSCIHVELGGLVSMLSGGMECSVPHDIGG
jgi:hypothetical protein